jgi:choline kinase
MKAIILAVGRGSRMKGWTQELPKTMLQLHGKPLLQRQVDALKHAGVGEIGVVTGYLKDKIQANGLTHRFENPRWAETNMVRSLMAAQQWLAKEPCLIGYGDIFYAPSAPLSLMKADADIAITYDVNFWELWSSRLADPLSDLENFRINSSNVVTDIGGRAQKREDIQGQYMGLLFVRPKGWQSIRTFLDSLPAEVVDKMDMTSMLKALIAAGVPVKGIAYHDAWGEADTPEDIEGYNVKALPSSLTLADSQSGDMLLKQNKSQ